ncbi:E3 ubiquitin-protein ligase E3D [Clarias magur]|uniref:E3 ubiquitin-protein ligase E3D n=1 Tax=Clarias magur TaxID=1594786 RepID=A0A8J4X732_CLAMG|nr:E3 ubiquitin-protein ligase E3D [Clarias magur]
MGAHFKSEEKSQGSLQSQRQMSAPCYFQGCLSQRDYGSRWENSRVLYQSHIKRRKQETPNEKRAQPTQTVSLEEFTMET